MFPGGAGSASPRFAGRCALCQDEATIGAAGAAFVLHCARFQSVRIEHFSVDGILMKGCASQQFLEEDGGGRLGDERRPRRRILNAAPDLADSAAAAQGRPLSVGADWRSTQASNTRLHVAKR